MSDPEVIADRERYAEVGRAYRQLQAAAELARQWRAATDDAALAEELLDQDGDDADTRRELQQARERAEGLEEQIRIAMVERDPNDEKNVIVEIQGGAGGEEAGLWAGDLYRMLTRYAESRGYQVESLDDRRRQVHVRGQGRRRLLGVQVRGRHPSRPARPPDRVPGAHPHLHRHGRGAARGRGRRRPDQPRRPADRRVPLLRPRRAVGQHHRLRRAHHPQAQRDRGLDAGREVPAAEPRARDAGAARAPVRAGARRTAGRARGRPPLAGGNRRPRREDPHLQLRRAARHRPPHQAHRRTTSTRSWKATWTRSPTRCSPTRSAGACRPRRPHERRRRVWRSRPTGELAAAGCEAPRLDAEVLLADSLGVPRGRLHSEPELVLEPAALEGFAEALRRRAAGREPVAYITSRRGFRALELAVDSRALIPRPETEHLVECALGLPAGWRVLDVGTGCGAVALALAHERPDLEVDGSDLSRAALALAAENSRASAPGRPVAARRPARRGRGPLPGGAGQPSLRGRGRTR